MNLFDDGVADTVTADKTQERVERLVSNSVFRRHLFLHPRHPSRGAPDRRSQKYHHVRRENSPEELGESQHHRERCSRPRQRDKFAAPKRWPIGRTEPTMAVRVRYRANELSEGVVEDILEANNFRVHEDNTLELRETWAVKGKDGKRRSRCRVVGEVHRDRWDSVVVLETSDA